MGSAYWKGIKYYRFLVPIPTRGNELHSTLYTTLVQTKHRAIPLFYTTQRQFQFEPLLELFKDFALGV
jgi:hypothetical protein